MFQVLTRGLANVIAPERCLVCLREGEWLCRDCAQDIPRAQQACIVCKQPRVRGVVCKRHGKKLALTGVISAGGYSWDYVRRGVHWLKFRGVKGTGPTLAALLAPYLSLIAPLPRLVQEAVLIPIPLHPRRQRERGFNQSLEITLALSEQLGIPFSELLQRVRATASQAELPHELRGKNVSEAFEISENSKAEVFLSKKYLILIDDVATTGSTLLSAAAVLKKHSLAQIWAATIARG